MPASTGAQYGAVQIRLKVRGDDHRHDKIAASDEIAGIAAMLGRAAAAGDVGEADVTRLRPITVMTTPVTVGVMIRRSRSMNWLRTISTRLPARQRPKIMASIASGPPPACLTGEAGGRDRADKGKAGALQAEQSRTDGTDRDGTG